MRSNKDPSVCVDTCNYTPTSQCDENNLCVEGCCSTYGVCGYGPDCKLLNGLVLVHFYDSHPC